MVDVEVAVKDTFAPNEPPEYLFERTLERIEVKVLMRLTGDLFLAQATDWQVELDVAEEVFSVEPSFLKSRLSRKIQRSSYSGFNDMDDDIPF